MFSKLTATDARAAGAPANSTLDGRTLPEIYVKRVVLSADQRVFLVKRGGMYRPITWGEAHQQSLLFFQALRTAGIDKGDRVAILSNSRPEWAIADITIQTLGAATVPIYQSSTAEDVSFILQNSGAKLVFAEDAAQGEKLAKAFAEMGKTLPVIFFDAGVSNPAYASQTVETLPKVDDRAALTSQQKTAAEAVRPEDLGSIVYTSGTTGKPKGVRLLHSSLTAETRSIVEEVELSAADTTLAFLPFAHVFGRIESLMPLVSGLTTAFAENVNAVAANLMEIQPTILMSVPRIYEKIYAKIVSDLESGAGYKRALFRWSVQTGREVARLRSQKAAIPLPLMLKFQVADQLVFSKVRERMGGRLRFTVSGGAPLAPELCEFFHACGVKVLEGYGLTETFGAISVNLPEDYRFGTVGRPIAYTHFRIAEDGEIQVKGPAIFDGYHGDEAASRETMTADGWFCTGDIGEFDEKGFLKITDRKKELIVTSGGKNVAPQKIENLLKQIPGVSQALVYGDKRKYLVALITLEKGKPDDVQIHAQIEAGIKAMNKSLASYETVKRFKVLPHDFTLESGELTPSLKLKRKVIVKKYQAEIDSLYESDGAANPTRR